MKLAVKVIGVVVLAAAGLALVACGGGPTPQEKVAAEAKFIAFEKCVRQADFETDWLAGCITRQGGEVNQEALRDCVTVWENPPTEVSGIPAYGAEEDAPAEMNGIPYGGEESSSDGIAQCLREAAWS